MSGEILIGRKQTKGGSCIESYVVAAPNQEEK